ncbi:hypothetical protein [Vibrio cidicii]|uniref:hypothetical protein n=1 Tax=Vibrio cidicii TaxID=1763883 RepID=UPI003704080C
MENKENLVVNVLSFRSRTAAECHYGLKVTLVWRAWLSSRMMSDFTQREKVVKEEQQSVEADELTLKFEVMEARIAELEAENKTLRDKLAGSELDAVNEPDVSLELTDNGAVVDVAA